MVKKSVLLKEILGCGVSKIPVECAGRKQKGVIDETYESRSHF